MRQSLRSRWNKVLSVLIEVSSSFYTDQCSVLSYIILETPPPVYGYISRTPINLHASSDRNNMLIKSFMILQVDWVKVDSW
jgi:hypothetical protein